ncbi:MAG TPA: hypothetical protein VIJ73_16965, partial [Methylomirabilota bacterium]
MRSTRSPRRTSFVPARAAARIFSLIVMAMVSTLFALARVSDSLLEDLRLVHSPTRPQGAR